MITDLLSIARQPDCMTGTGLRLFGLNILHASSSSQPWRYALALFVAETLHSEAPAAAIIPKVTFSRPMAPSLDADHILWEAHIAPHLSKAIAATRTTLGGLGLAGVMEQARRLLLTQPGMITEGGGGLVIPTLACPTPPASAPRVAVTDLPPVRRIIVMPRVQQIAETIAA